MSEELVLETLRAVRADISEVRSEAREQRGRLGAMVRLLTHVERDAEERRTEICSRFDRVLDWLDRVEQRLGLRDG